LTSQNFFQPLQIQPFRNCFTGNQPATKLDYIYGYTFVFSSADYFKRRRTNFKAAAYEAVDLYIVFGDRD